MDVAHLLCFYVQLSSSQWTDTTSTSLHMQPQSVNPPFQSLENKTRKYLNSSTDLSLTQSGDSSLFYLRTMDFEVLTLIPATLGEILIHQSVSLPSLSAVHKYFQLDVMQDKSFLFFTCGLSVCGEAGTGEIWPVCRILHPSCSCK